jgi:hypothetical protein
MKEACSLAHQSQDKEITHYYGQKAHALLVLSKKSSCIIS